MAVNATSFRRDWFLLYGGANYPERPRRDTLIAQRSNPGMGVSGFASDMDIIKSINPDFIWLLYISAEDNYVPPYSSTEESDFLDSIANANGQSKEIHYLHYWDTTRVTLGGTTVTIPAYQYAVTSQDSFNSRIPVYYSNLTRRLKNYSNSNSIINHVLYVQYRIKKINVNHYYSGIWFDNSAHRLYNYGSVVSGGHVYESPIHQRIDSIGRTDTGFWWSNLKQFYYALKDTMRNSTIWSADGKHKVFGFNQSNLWTDQYADSNLTDFLFPEFEYSPVRDRPLYNVYYRDSIAAANGVKLCWMALPTTSVNGYSGSYTYQEALLGNLCYFYVTCSDSAIFYQQGTNAIDNPDWDTKVWCGAMDYNVGRPVDAKYSIAQSGTDGEGYSYTIYKRQYQNALIFVRPRGRWNQNIDAGTAVTYNLGGTYKEVLPDGSLGTEVNAVTFRNGQGRIMKPVSTSIDSVAPGMIGDLSCSSGTGDGRINLTWTATGDDGNQGTAFNYVIKYSLSPITASNWSSVTDSMPFPPLPAPSGSSQSATLSNLNSGTVYYIALKVYDDAFNVSPLSNVVSCEASVNTTGDITAPAGITDLSCVTGDGDGKINISWTATGDDGSQGTATTYLIKYSLDSITASNWLTVPDSMSNPPTPAVSGIPQSTALTNLAPGSVYYIAMKVYDDALNISPLSNVVSCEASVSIITGNEESDFISATLIPDSGATLSASEPILSARNIIVTGQNFYYFDIATDSNFYNNLISSPPIAQSNHNFTDWQVTVPLEKNQTYYWRVRVNDYPYSKVSSFTVAQADYKAYPTKVHFQEGEKVTFDLPDKPVDLLIQTISGETILIKKRVSGQWEWDGRNASGNLVSVGIYSWFIKDTKYNGKIVVKP
ncbi:MAG: hypothetical protein GXO93_01310 [FCB group bacterium]|nr:hypothetical protein [FCB group bacterium]